MKVLQPFQSHFVQLDASASARGSDTLSTEMMSEIVFLGVFFQAKLFKTYSGLYVTLNPEVRES